MSLEVHSAADVCLSELFVLCLCSATGHDEAMHRYESSLQLINGIQQALIQWMYCFSRFWRVSEYIAELARSTVVGEA